MATTIAQLNVRVGGDVSEAKAKLNEISGHVNTVGEHFKSALGNVLGLGAGIGVIGAVSTATNFLVGQLKDVVTQGMAQQKVMAETSNVLAHMGSASGQTAASIGDYADSMARATGISDDLIQHGENVLATFANIGGKVFPAATTAALNMSTMLGQDLQSSVIQVGKALNDPIQGMTALSRVGVSFTQVEKDQIKAMQSHNNIAGAQAVIMSELNKQFGGAAVAAGSTFGGQLARLGVISDQFKEKLGLALIPMLSKLMSAFTPVIGALGSQMPAIMEKVSSFMNSTLSPAIARLAGYVQTDIVPALGKLVASLEVNVLPVVTKLAAFIGSDVLPVLVKLGAFILTQVEPAIYKMQAALVAALLPALRALWNVIATNVLPAVEGIWRNISANLLPALEKLISKLAPVLVPAFQLVGWVLGNIVGPALNIVIGIISKLIDFLATAIGKIGDFLGVLGKIKDAAGNALGGVGDALHGAHIPGFAMGGITPYTGVFRVGELGPETVVLPGGSRVIPSNQSQPNRSIGSGGSTYNFYVTKEDTAQDIERILWKQSLLHG